MACRDVVWISASDMEPQCLPPVEVLERIGENKPATGQIKSSGNKLYKPEPQTLNPKP